MPFIDPYSRQTIQNYLLSEIEYLSGRHYKLFAHMGDRVAMSAYMITCAEQRLSDAVVADRMLIVIRLAFAVPDGVRIPVDRLPVFSMFVCQHILEASGAEDVREKARLLLSELVVIFEKAKPEFEE